MKIPFDSPFQIGADYFSYFFKLLKFFFPMENYFWMNRRLKGIFEFSLQA